MGCDIHVYIEKRLRPEDAWQLDENHTVAHDDDDEPRYLEQVSATNRDYHLFGILAGVRGGRNPLFPQRGIPKDATEILAEYAEGPDWHSHSWLTLAQFKKCLEKAENYYPNNNKSTDAFYSWKECDWATMPQAYTTMINYCEEWIANETAEAILLNRTDVKPEVRIIFWFDN
jgi:hypothetical protein